MPHRTDWRLWLLLCLQALSLGTGCAHPSATDPAPAGARQLLTSEEIARLFAEVEGLIADDSLDEALLAIEDGLAKPVPEAARRRFQELRRQVLGERFYRDHPLHLTLRVEPRSVRFGEQITLVMRITNLGSERLELPAGHRTLADRLMFRAGEKSVLLVEVESRDADGHGSFWGQRHQVEVPLADDLLLAAGGSAEITTSLAVPAGGQAVHRLLRISALYRPIAMLTEGGEYRYDPLAFPEVTVPVVRAVHARWLDGGIELLATCVDGAAVGRPETLFVTALGLPAEQLRAGVDLLARAAPSLDPGRRAAALAAIQAITGHSTGNDATRTLGWWLAEGAKLPDAALSARTGADGDGFAGRLKVAGGAAQSDLGAAGPAARDG